MVKFYYNVALKLKIVVLVVLSFSKTFDYPPPPPPDFEVSDYYEYLALWQVQRCAYAFHTKVLEYIYINRDIEIAPNSKIIKVCQINSIPPVVSVMMQSFYTIFIALLYNYLHLRAQRECSNKFHESYSNSAVLKSCRKMQKN